MATQNAGAKRRAVVTYGSETGTAQDIAEEIAKLTKRLYFSTTIAELDDIRLNDLVRADIVIIAISTTGQGDLPANARGFWARLRSSKLKTSSLSTTKFTSFGIGDSSYANFNWAHRKLCARLSQLGAQCVYEQGEADEQHQDGLDGLFLPWFANLRKALIEKYPLPNGHLPIADEDFLQPEWELAAANESSTKQLLHGQSLPYRVNGSVETQKAATNDPRQLKSSLIPAELISNERLTPQAHWQDVRLFEFSIPMMDYEPGDVMKIFPKNAEDDVAQLIHIMQWTHVADTEFSFVPAVDDPDQTRPPVPIEFPHQRKTLRSIIRDHLDLNDIPRRSFFSAIAHFTDDEFQKQRLIEFTNPELIDELWDYTSRPRRSIIEVLQEFDTVKIPHKWAASIFPLIRGRQFSIASGGKLRFGPRDDTRIQLLVAIVKYRTVIKKLRQGLCTRYLAELKQGARMDIALSKSGMRVRLNKPAIMVSPGTGVAPLRAMIYERAMRQRSDDTLGQTEALFFGARNRDADFFFCDEWKSLGNESDLQVVPAFSRDQKNKIYVQDKIREYRSLIYELLQKDAVIYLCGSSGKMPQAVRLALVDVIKEQRTVSPEEAESYVANLEKTGRYQQETW